MFSDISASTWLNWVNNIRIVAGALAAIAAIATGVATYAQLRLQTIVSTQKEAKAEELRRKSDERIATANAAGETARAEAAQAKLETVEVSERLALTQERLDKSLQVTPLTDHQIEVIMQGLIKVPLGDTQPVWGAANDLQAQRRLLQLSNAALAVDRRLHPARATGSMVAPVGEVGDVLIHYWSDDRHDVAFAIAEVFRAANLIANVYKLPPEPDLEAQHMTQNMVLVGFAARETPKFNTER